jgi:hypothetical protein
MAGILLTCGYIALFLYLVRKQPFFAVPGLSTRAIGVLFLLKIAAGTALWWVYTYHYPDRSTADIFKYFDDGLVMYSALPSHPEDFFHMICGIGNDTQYFTDHYYGVMNNWHRRYDTGYYNDAHTMIRFNALVRVFSFGVYHVHTVFASFLGLVGSIALYKTFIGFVPKLAKGLAAGIFLWPSVLFWTSAPLKESLLFLGLGLFLLQVFRAMAGPLPWSGWGFMVLGLLIQLSLKSYVLACMVPGLIALWWCRRAPAGKAWPKFAFTHAIALLLVLALPWAVPQADAVALIHQKQHDMLGLAAATHPASQIPMPPLEPGLEGLLLEAPRALYLTFVSPFTQWDRSALGLVTALENALLLLLLPLTLLVARQRIHWPLLLYCLAFCLLLALLIGWTTPVVGALVRYRVPMLPFWSLAALLITNPQRVLRWPFFRTS